MTASSVLFVCMGNLCRSPMAHGMLRAFAANAGCAGRVIVDSAGTHARHGYPPEKFAIEAAAAYGADIGDLRSRAIGAEDFVKFDQIVAMDLDNLDYLRAVSPDETASRINLLLRYAPELHLVEVPDPYGCKLSYFEHVAKLIAAGSQQLLNALLAE